MAGTAHHDEEQMKEHFDPPDVLEEKIKKLASFIAESKHCVAFTGAGISTSAGIHDFRGPKGKWTRQAKGLAPLRGKDSMTVIPTKTHMALVKLARVNRLKYLISQNCDGLHLRSGFPKDRLSELHGNGNKEICEICGQTYFRDLKCMRIKRGRDHFTGRYCNRKNCDGRLLNSTIDFGQNLHEMAIELADSHSEQADLHIALGSSLTVSPACDCPATTAEKGGRLVIINLQKTPLSDHVADMHIFAKTDEVMERVMQLLQIEIPPFRLLRKLVVGCDPDSGSLYAHGADVDDPTLEMDFVQSVTWGNPVFGSEEDLDYFDHSDQIQLKRDVVFNDFTAPMQFIYEEVGNNRIFTDANVQFVGNYREPNLAITVDFTECYLSNRRVEYLWSLEYDPFNREWVAECELSTLEQTDFVNDDSYGRNHAKYCIEGMVKSGRKTKSQAKKLWKLHVKRTSKPKPKFIKPKLLAIEI